MCRLYSNAQDSTQYLYGVEGGDIVSRGSDKILAILLY